MSLKPVLLHLSEVSSTNTWMLNSLSEGSPLDEGFVAYTLRQTQGRGQVGNRWESAPDCNIAFSMLLRPEFLPVPRQFLISEVCSLGVLDGLLRLCGELDKGNEFIPQLCIKWPNDIYWGDEKLGGILIENRLMGSRLSQSVLGVGLNVRQLEWTGGAPNPTSLLLHGVDLSPVRVLEALTEGIWNRFCKLRSDWEEYAFVLHTDFLAHLYRREGFFPYVEVQSGAFFEAALADVDPQGPIVLQLQNGECRRYWFKEVKFVLPCGITKE